jgi:hypothetical protein
VLGDLYAGCYVECARHGCGRLGSQIERLTPDALGPSVQPAPETALAGLDGQSTSTGLGSESAGSGADIDHRAGGRNDREESVDDTRRVRYREAVKFPHLKRVIREPVEVVPLSEDTRSQVHAVSRRCNQVPERALSGRRPCSGFTCRSAHNHDFPTQFSLTN